MTKNSQWLSDKDYNFIFDQVPRLCVDLVIKGKSGLVLSLRNIEPAKNTWHLPGGRVYFRENLTQATKRIAREETGLKVEVSKFLGVIEYCREVQNGHKRHTVSVVFQVKQMGGKLRGSFQAQNTRFFKQLPVKIHKPHADFLKKLKGLYSGK